MPYSKGESKTGEVEQMFDSIAPAYDFMNRAMTLGIDRQWRARAVKQLARRTPVSILDIATGTGDLAIALARRISGATVTGVDLSAGMVNIGRAKIAKAGLADRVKLEVADCLALPYPDDTFDCVTAAYGVRNFADIEAGYREMHRVMKHGATLCVIELSTPVNRAVKPLYRFYTRGIIPTIGRLISKDSRAYTYLPESIAAVPQRDDMCHLMRKAGFTDCRWQSLTFGVCCIYTALKP